MSSAPKKPAGVVVVITDPDGAVIATHADFDRSGYGGMTMMASQTMRARSGAQTAAVRAYCSRRLADCFDGYLFERCWEALRSKGWTATVIPVGHGDSA